MTTSIAESELSPTLTENQLVAAAPAPGPTAVVAGPGAGKTRVLVERYLAVITSGAGGVPNIAVLTYTAQAAAELKEKIAARFRAEAAAAADPLVREFWRQREYELCSAPIGTIHQFCARLLREIPGPARRSHPGPFRILTDAEARRLLREAAEAVVRDIPGDVCAEEWLAAYGPHGLRDLLTEAYRLYARTGRAPTTAAAPHAAEEAFRAALTRLTKAVAALREVCGAEVPPADAEHALFAALTEPPTADRMGRVAEALAAFRRVLPAARGKAAAGVKSIRELVGDRTGGTGRLLGLYADCCAAPHRAALGRLLDDLDRRYRAAKQDQFARDFEDLLDDALFHLETPETRVMACTKYPHLLIDEAQDSDPRQWRIFKLMGAFEASPRRSAFVVGDPRQSIYAFRGADVEAYTAAVREMTDSGRRLTLPENFRARPAIVHWINAFFQEVFPDAPASRPVRPETPTAHPPVLWLAAWGDPQAGLTAAQGRAAEAERLARHIRRRTAPNGAQTVSPNDIAVLFPTLNDSVPYVAAFEAAGINYRVVGAPDFWIRPEIEPLMAWLQWLADPHDDLALAALLRSPVCGFSDALLLKCSSSTAAAPLLRRLRTPPPTADAEETALLSQTNHRLAAWLTDHSRLPERLRRLVTETAYDVVCAAAPDGERRLANIERFCNLVAAAAAACDDPGEVLRRLEDFRDEPSAAGPLPPDAVQIMTIHRAKGLEFPVVVLPNLQRRWAIARQPIVLHPDYGVVCDLPGDAGERFAPAMKTEAEAGLAATNLAERKRLLYVAMTRARDQLILSSYAPWNEEKKSQPPASALDWMVRRLHPPREGECSASLGPAQVCIQAETCAGVQRDDNDREGREDAPPAAPAPAPAPAVTPETRRQIRLLELAYAPPPTVGRPERAHYTSDQLADFALCPYRFALQRWFPMRPEDSPTLSALLTHGRRALDDDPGLTPLEAARRAERRFRQAPLPHVAQRLRELLARYAQTQLHQRLKRARRAGENVVCARPWTALLNDVVVGGHLEAARFPASSRDPIQFAVYDPGSFTFRTTDPNRELEREARRRRAAIKAQITAAALRRSGRSNPIEAMIAFLREGRVEVIPQSRLAHPVAERVVAELTERLTEQLCRSRPRFEPQPGPACFSCRHQTLCPAAARPPQCDAEGELEAES